MEDKNKQKEKEENTNTISVSQSQSQTIESVTDSKDEQPVVKRYHRRYRETKTSNNNTNTAKNGNSGTVFTSANSNVYSRHRKK